MNRTRSKNDHVWLLKAAGLTDCGRRKQVNEDAVFNETGQTNSADSVGLYMVCDGLGGLQAGEIASHLAIETVARELMPVLFSSASASNGENLTLSGSRLKQYIQTAITKANAKIRDYGEPHHPQKVTNLGTTLTMLLIYGGVAHIANIVDSRTYRFRHGQVTQITEDHSLAAGFARLGQIDQREIINLPSRNVLYRSLGTRDKIEVDLFEQELQADDKLLLCSDGLWQAFPDAAELATWFDQAALPAVICQQLVTEAYRRAGTDNISAVVVRVNKKPNRHLEAANTKTAVPVQELM